MHTLNSTFGYGIVRQAAIRAWLNIFGMQAVYVCRIYISFETKGAVGMSLNRVRSEQTDLLMQAMLEIKNVDEGYALFEDLCTIREVQDLAQRIHVAKLLREHITYHDIATQTGASTATISRVNRALVYGAGGYETVLGRLIDEKQENGSGEDK